MNETLSPTTAEQLAEILREASARGQPVVPWGAGTLQHLGAQPPAGALALHTQGLDRVLEYNPADLTITVEAGAALGALQAILEPHGQWLPWRPPAPDRATIGGLLAAGVSGPLRLGYGTPRDWVLGMRVALGDGRLVKSGGKVVKNVAGYDTHKLHIGALGTLGAIAAVTLKVAPLPERMETRLFACDSLAAALELGDRLRARPLAPASLLLDDLGAEAASAVPGAPRAALLAVQFAGVPPAVERQARAAEAAAAALRAERVELGAEQARELWRELALFSAADHVARTTGGSAPARELVIRAGARASALGGVLAALERAAFGGAAPRVIGYPGVGLAYARWRAGPDTGAGAISAALGELRRDLKRELGYAVVEYAPEELRAQLDLWGEPPATIQLMRGLKAQWDPRGILNPGRYVGGL